MSIALTQGMRNAVYSMTDIQDQINISNKRLATGKKVNDTLDNASAYFRSQSYLKESRDLSGLLDGMDTALRAVTKTTDAMDAARKMIESAQSLARQALTLGAGDASRDTCGSQAAEMVNQAAKILNDAKFGGLTLLQTNETAATGLTLTFNNSTGDGKTDMTITGEDMRFSSTTGIGKEALVAATHGIDATSNTNKQEKIAYASGAADKWSDATNGDKRATKFIDFTAAALIRLQAAGSGFATKASAIQIRQEFTKNWIRTNNEAASYLTVADMNEEGANLSALQTKQQLAVQSLALANRTDQAILRLF